MFLTASVLGSDVYTILGAQGITVSGGRIHGVGVGGYLLGGGFSYLSSEVRAFFQVLSSSQTDSPPLGNVDGLINEQRRLIRNCPSKCNGHYRLKDLQPRALLGSQRRRQ